MRLPVPPGCHVRRELGDGGAGFPMSRRQSGSNFFSENHWIFIRSLVRLPRPFARRRADWRPLTRLRTLSAYAGLQNWTALEANHFDFAQIVQLARRRLANVGVRALKQGALDRYKETLRDL